MDEEHRYSGIIKRLPYRTLECTCIIVIYYEIVAGIDDAAPIDLQCFVIEKATIETQ